MIILTNRQDETDLLIPKATLYYLTSSGNKSMSFASYPELATSNVKGLSCIIVYVFKGNAFRNIHFHHLFGTGSNMITSVELFEYCVLIG